MGLDVYLTKMEEGKDLWDYPHVDEPSPTHPDHLFRIGYWRSSYNGSGINRILEAADLPRLSEMVMAGADEEGPVDWAAARERVADVLSAWRSRIQQPLYRATSVSFYPNGSLPTGESEALATFDEGIGTSRFEAFTSRDGLFDKEGMPIHAAIPGKDILGMPCVWLVYQQSHVDSYTASLEVVLETVDWVLKQEDPSSYRLWWSR